MAKIKMGTMRVVKNTNPRPNASESYVALWVEDEGGENERCLMFRKPEVGKFPEFSFPTSMGIEGRMKAGRLYRMSSGTTEFYAVKVVDGGEEKVVKLTDKKIETAERLAESNSEDIPDRGIWNDIVD